MTQTITPKTEPADTPEPKHVHPLLTWVAISALALAVVGGAFAVGALMIMPDEAVGADPVAVADGAAAGVGTGTADVVDVIPDFVPKAQLSAVPASEVNVSYAPDVPPAAVRTTPAIVDVHFEIAENVVAIDPATGTEYETWGYRLMGDGLDVSIGTPGPMIRARVGDVLRFTLTNPEGNVHPHNVDFHAVTGQGGGAADTTVAPGETKTIEARLLYPGVFMYHCAYGDVPAHIAHGMYGGILVDPETPLPEVDHEWYMVQSEYYTDGTTGGIAETDRAALSLEEPTMVVFNGAKGALIEDNALHMSVGERARFYFVNAGLNLDSNFHPIGSHWDVVYPEAALLSPPIRGSQTTLVPAGGGVVAELVGQVPSTIVLVDHALVRTFDKGAVGHLIVDGEPNHEIFEVIGGEAANEKAPSAVAESEEGIPVSILAGSGTFQADDAADEFSDSEAPGDYSVNVLTIPVGTTVMWTNDDAMVHTVTAVDGKFDSGMMAEGDTWSYTFDTPGEYEYLCSPHPWMRAKVIVEG